MEVADKYQCLMKATCCLIFFFLSQCYHCCVVPIVSFIADILGWGMRLNKCHINTGLTHM